MKRIESKPGVSSAPAERDCKTLDLGIADYAECLRAGPNDCRYALPFGYAFLCRHSRLSTLAAGHRSGRDRHSRA